MARKKASSPTYRVKRAFTHGGVYYTNHNAAKIAQLPESVREDRIKRGYITERGAAKPPAPKSEE